MGGVPSIQRAGGFGEVARLPGTTQEECAVSVPPHQSVKPVSRAFGADRL